MRTPKHIWGVMAGAAFAAALFAAPVQADGLRAAVRDGYGRIVFDWDTPVRYAADVVGGELVVQFERPITGNIGSVAQALGPYVGAGRMSADRRTAIFPLRANVTMRTFTVGNAVVVDLTGPQPPPQQAQQTPPAQQNPTALIRPAAPARASTPAAPAAAPAAPQPANTNAVVGAIPVRTGTHPDYFRIVFDWPVATAFQVERRGDRAAIVFNRLAAIDQQALARRLPAAHAGVTVGEEAGKIVVSIPVPATQQVRTLANGNSIVVDLMGPPGAPAAQAAAAPAAPAAPAAAPPAQPPATRTPAATTQPATPPPAQQGAAPPPRGPSAAARALLAGPTEGVEVDASGRRVTRAATADRAVDPLSGRPAEVSLTIPFDEAAAAAVFRRAEYLWVVFDRYKQVNVDELAKKGAPYITLVEQLPYRTNTILRMVTQPDINPSVRRDGLDWVLDFRNLPIRPTKSIEVTPQIDRPQPNVYLPVTEAGRTVAFDDPEVGDYLLVVPVIPLGYGVYPERSFPDLDLPVTAQGVVVVPKSDGVRALATRSGIDVDVEGGMALSKAASEQASVQAKEEDLNRILNFGDWQIGKAEDYYLNKQAMQNAIADETNAATKQESRLRFARFEYINKFYPEVLAILRVMQATDPEIENTAPYRALRGAANMMMRRWQEAADDFGHFSLANEEDARFWLAAARSKLGPAEAEAQALIQTGSVIRTYPREIKVPLALIGTEAAIAAGDDFGAQGFLDMIRRERPGVNEQAAIDYLDGKLNQKIGEFKIALEQYGKAENAGSLLYNVLGMRDRMELEYQLGTVKIDDLIEAYEKLRYRWRGDDIELSFLTRLAELHAEKNDYGSALRILKLATQYFRDYPGADKAAEKMTAMFEELYLNGAADKLPPVQAIGLFDEFRILVPPGDKGDEMIRRLADRLVSIDLLEQAALLLERQIQFRVTGIEKARIGSRLALVRLLNREPDAAIAALMQTNVPDAPPDLQAQRRRLEARALTDMRRADDAILLLGADTTDETKQLRAEIYWRTNDWPNAAKALADLVPEPGAGSLSDQNARLVLDWVTALTLAKDDRTIMRVRQRYLSAMLQTPYKDAFDLITAERDQPADPTTVRQQIEQAQNFKSFLVEYKDMIGDKPLSQIN